MPLSDAVLPTALPEAADRAGVDREARAVDVSVLVPVTERPEPLDELYREFAAPFLQAHATFEFLFLMEPWAHAFAASLEPLIAAGEPIRVLEVGRGTGEAALLRAGAAAARSEVVLTLPGYRRVVASSLLAVIAPVSQGGADVAVARRWPRRDSRLNQLQNRALHAVLHRISGTRMHDVACGVRAMRREVLQELPLYGDVFRFIPVIANREGYRVEEVPAPQHPEDVRARVYAPAIYLRRLLDLLGLFFLLRFREKPLRFFGLVGSTLSAAGGLILLVLTAQRIQGEPLADRPLLLVGILLFVLGIQAIGLGLIGEIIVYFRAPERRLYRVARDEQEMHCSAVRDDDASDTSRGDSASER